MYDIESAVIGEVPMPIDVYSLDYFRETLHTGQLVVKLYRERELSCPSTTVMFTTEIT